MSTARQDGRLTRQQASPMRLSGIGKVSCRWLFQAGRLAAEWSKFVGSPLMRQRSWRGDGDDEECGSRETVENGSEMELCKGRRHYGWSRAFEVSEVDSTGEIAAKPKMSFPLTAGATDVTHRHIRWQPQTETSPIPPQAFSEGESRCQLMLHLPASVRRAPSMLYAPNKLNS